MPEPIAHSPDDWELAGRTLFGEARGQPFRGQVAVAWVIRNRVQKPGWWGTSVREVCLKDKQFSCWNPGDPNRDLILAVNAQNPHFRRAMSIVGLVFSGDLADPTGAATHYWTGNKPAWATSWPPVWSKDLKTTTTIGAHVFQREFREGEVA